MEPREGAAQGVCVACRQPISDAYYEAAGRVFCAECRDAVASELSGGFGAVRLLKALAFGLGAAAVSAVVWYGIAKLGFQLGIIAVVVGLAVGGAVRYGAEHRGGWAYQTIAVVLTYLAIAASWLPPVMESFRAQAAEQVSQSDDPAPAIDETLLLVSAIVLSLELPVLQATEGTGIIGVLIVSFALYEAWKINKRRVIVFSGPFRLQRTAGISA
jgi:hypothetical protein